MRVNIEEYTREYSEFEIQAVAYCRLKNYYKDFNIVRGEITLSDERIGYSRCDIAIFDKITGELRIIIEVKKNKKLLEQSRGQIELYERFCNNVIVISSMREAEGIIKQVSQIYRSPAIDLWD